MAPTKQKLPPCSKILSTSRAEDSEGAKPSRITDRLTTATLLRLWELAPPKIDLHNVKLGFRRADDVSYSDLDDCRSIVKHTSYDDYKNSSHGWNEKHKMREMEDPNMLYILVRSADGSDATFAPSLPTNILGFISFMVAKDDPPYEDVDVVYIYEVHVGDQMRGKGLGSWLVHVAEHAAEMAGIPKTMLTVFTSNEAAMGLYRHLGYRKDDASPEGRRVRGRVIQPDYLILSKLGGGNGGAFSGRLDYA
ncbi:acyl-CoA N-acyltransferase [Trematosphaeria pertusa]|uniref:N-alpha-acetyltransferase 40 n=1 Tax=Trematosphaeria pertusa TaxID=390896 RepID=A0A6A6HX96_9PLEO|nr:acyl-CoA N-acyltransferase [Trematosphaeria pertusa]KAF2242651.1 acyl-CoA N-acyltransferase [Trematosphaeria pertusa]